MDTIVWLVILAICGGVLVEIFTTALDEFRYWRASASADRNEHRE